REEKGRSEVSKQSSSGHRATIVPAKGYKRLRFARTKEHEIFPSLQCSVRSPIDPEGSCPPPPSLPFPLPSLLPPQDGLFKYFESYSVHFILTASLTRSTECFLSTS